MDEDGATPIKYEPPASGKNEGKKFKLKAYTAIMEGATITGYGCVTYPGCKGTPVLFNFEDNVFQSNEYTINSTPGAGEKPYTWERVEELPTYANPNVPLGELDRPERRRGNHWNNRIDGNAVVGRCRK